MGAPAKKGTLALAKHRVARWADTLIGWRHVVPNRPSPFDGCHRQNTASSVHSSPDPCLLPTVGQRPPLPCAHDGGNSLTDIGAVPPASPPIVALTCEASPVSGRPSHLPARRARAFTVLSRPPPSPREAQQPTDGRRGLPSVAVPRPAARLPSPVLRQTLRKDGRRRTVGASPSLRIAAVPPVKTQVEFPSLAPTSAPTKATAQGPITTGLPSSATVRAAPKTFSLPAPPIQPSIPLAALWLRPCGAAVNATALVPPPTPGLALCEPAASPLIAHSGLSAGAWTGTKPLVPPTPSSAVLLHREVLIRAPAAPIVLTFLPQLAPSEGPAVAAHTPRPAAKSVIPRPSPLTKPIAALSRAVAPTFPAPFPAKGVLLPLLSAQTAPAIPREVSVAVVALASAIFPTSDVTADGCTAPYSPRPVSRTAAVVCILVDHDTPARGGLSAVLTSRRSAELKTAPARPKSAS